MTAKGLLTLAILCATVAASACGTVLPWFDNNWVGALVGGGLMLAGCLVVAAIIKAVTTENF